MRLSWLWPVGWRDRGVAKAPGLKRDAAGPDEAQKPRLAEASIRPNPTESNQIKPAGGEKCPKNGHAGGWSGQRLGPERPQSLVIWLRLHQNGASVSNGGAVGDGTT